MGLFDCLGWRRALGISVLLCAAACGGGEDSDAKPATKKPKKTLDAGHDAGRKEQESDQSGTWGLMGFDARSSYFNPNEHTLSPDNASSLEEKWRFSVAGFPAGAPAIGENKVFVTATGATYGISFKTGEMIWVRDDIHATASPAYANGAVYVHTTDAFLYR